MILNCPSCRTRYQAETARFVPSGRNVRCARCGQVWFQSPPEPEPHIEQEQIFAAPPPPAASAPAVAEAQIRRAASEDMASLDFSPTETGSVETETVTSAPAPPVPRRAALPLSQVAGWAAIAFILAALGWAGLQYRQTIANLWPQSASLYSAMGMPVNVRGIALINVSYQQDFEDGQPVLSVTGKVINISDHELAVPGLRVVLTDDGKHELYHWTFDVGIPTLKAGAESSFITRLSSPPPEARNLNIRFADAGETQ